MTSVLNSVTSWLGGSRERDRTPPGENERAADSKSEEGGQEAAPVSDAEETAAGTSSTNDANAASESSQNPTASLALDVNLQEVSEKAVNVAKEWGSYLFNVGKTATEQVAKTAKQLRDTVEEKTILGDFVREQDKFISEHREKKKQSETAVPPWVGYNEEEAMKVQILALSKDKRNFLRNPPAGVQFSFDYESNFPVAMVMLEEDPNLKEMRFKLVPKELKEDIFWRNYFYRVSLIKQSTQLTSLAQHSASKTSISIPSSSKSESTASRGEGVGESEEMAAGSPPAIDHEFVSDAFQTGSINADELKKEMDQLGVSEKKKEAVGKKKTGGDDDWERELQAELQEYEVVDDGNTVDDADLEREIMKQIEDESKQT